MEAICSSEAPVEFQRTTRRYIPEDEHSRKGPKSYEIVVFSENLTKSVNTLYGKIEELSNAKAGSTLRFFGLFANYYKEAEHNIFSIILCTTCILPLTWAHFLYSFLFIAHCVVLQLL
jgi:hypothetical protein